LVPAWADPGIIAYGTAVRRNQYTLPGGSALSVARPDPTRIAIGFAAGALAVAAISVAPGPDPFNEGWAVTQLSSDNWYTIFEFGPLVQLGWFADAASGGAITVYEIYRL
jgi:hypothetical protein